MGKLSGELASFLMESSCRLEIEKISDEIEKFLSYQSVGVGDKRKSHRVPVCISAAYFACRGKEWDRQEKRIQILNLSATGVKGIVFENIRPGSFLFIRFDLARHLRLHVLGEVRWSSALAGSMAVGILFRNPEPGYKRSLEEFVDQERGVLFDRIAKKTGKERRKFYRLAFHESLPYQVYTPHSFQKWEKQKERISLVNLSGGGAKIGVSAKLKKGTLVSFELPFGKEKLPLMGEVAWEKPDPVRGYTYGIRFMDLEERHREAIIRFVLLEEQRHRRLQDN